MAVTLCLSCSSDAQPEPWGPLCWVLAFFIVSSQHLLWTPNSIGVPEGPFGRVWLSLPHLGYIPVRSSTQLTPSVQFVGLILPSNSHAVIWTRLHASAISSDIWRSGCVTSAIFGMACVIVIERK